MYLSLTTKGEVAWSWRMGEIYIYMRYKYTIIINLFIYNILLYLLLATTDEYLTIKDDTGSGWVLYIFVTLEFTLPKNNIYI